MSRVYGTVSMGLRAPIIRQGDDLVKIVTDSILEAMKAEGAEATMIFLHWGEEYDLRGNAAQQKMAQKLCDMGFDVIVGGHAHVVQPVTVMFSQGPYSLLPLEALRQIQSSAHTT